MYGALATLPIVPLVSSRSVVDDLAGLRAALGGGPRLLMKRDDTMGFAFGGNKVRKMQFVAAAASAAGADTLITCGGVQSNHARVTAAVAARLGMRCILVANGRPPDRPTGNALLNSLLGAEIRYVHDRGDRAAAMDAAANEIRRNGGSPYVIPLGASVPLGAAAFVDAVRELLDQIDPPDLIVHASSSGGTQAGLVAGCALAAVHTRVLGVSADASASELVDAVSGILDGLAPLLGVPRDRLRTCAVDVDDGFVGEGYGVPTDASREALVLTARTEGVFLDPTYTAKAMAGLFARVRAHAFGDRDSVLFWHTGGQVALFA